MTPIELHRLAGAIATLRPDWPAASLQTFLERHYAHRPIRDIAPAVIACALDPATATPARSLEAGPWWTHARTSAVPRTVNDCPTHPLSELRVDAKTGASCCAGCHVDARADESATAVFVRRPVPETARRRATPTAATPTRKATG